MSDAMNDLTTLQNNLRLIGHHAAGTVHLVVSTYDVRVYVDRDGMGYRDSEWGRGATIAEAVDAALRSVPPTAAASRVAEGRKENR